MCRFIAYLGKPFVVHDILYKPDNSLIKQSIHAHELEEPLNGDGFGMSWFSPKIDDLPGVFKTIQPAWNDSNLETLSAKIMSGCFFAHVRAASGGDVNIFNTHPFNYHQYSFMHNGNIGGFDKIRRLIRRDLSDEIDDWIKGQTDSEHFFAVFLERFKQKKQPYTLHLAAEVMKEALDYVDDLQKKFHIQETTYINAVVGDGKTMLAIRYVTNQEKAASLHYSLGHRLEYFDGYCHMHPSKEKPHKTILIASEKLTSHKMDWHDVPTNHMLLVDERLNFEIRSIS